MSRPDRLFTLALSSDEMAAPIKASGLKTYAMPEGMNPTAENMAAHLAGKAKDLLRNKGIVVTKVRLLETPNAWADWELER